MIRAFVAIEIPEPVRARFGEAIDELRRLDLHARFSRVESLHLTLKFLGDIQESWVDAIQSTLAKALSDSPAGDGTVSGLGTFPSSARPRVVWAGVEGAGLKEVQARVERAAAELGFEREQREFRPHLTLARIKSTKNLKKLRIYLGQPASAFHFGTFPISEVALFQSILGPDGARYRKLFAFALAGE